jgi:oligoribonuclease
MTTATPHTGDVLAWIDVETTGLDPHFNELLEIACILTDVQLRPLAEPFHRVLQYDERQTALIKEYGTSDFVLDMHEKTGLWDKLKGGTPRPLVDEQLLDYIKSVAPEKRQARVVGNSVRLDLNFLEQYLPKSYEHLHYRSVDVTGFEFLLASWGLASTEKAEPEHTAIGDITASIVQLHSLKTQLEADR